MADDVFGFIADDVSRIRDVVSFVEKSPRYATKQRRYGGPPPVANGGGSGTESCGCCDNKDCVSPDEAMIRACAECDTGATTEYTFTIGFPTTYSELEDTTTLTFSGSCTWLSEVITVAAADWVASRYYYTGDYVKNGANLYVCTNAGTSAASVGPTGTGSGITDGGVQWDYSVSADTGNYQWQLTQAGLSSTLSLTLDSGTDVMNLGDRPLTYIAEAPWSCRCISKMVLSTAESLMDSNGVDSVVCLTPVASTGCCTNCWGVTFSGITGPPAECLGINGPWVLTYAGNTIEGCQWDQGSGINVHLSWNRSTSIASLTVSGASFPFIYRVTDADLCNGESKTLTLVGGSACTGVPSTVTLSPVDCATTTTTSTSTSTTSTSTTTASTTTGTTSTTTGTTSTTTGSTTTETTTSTTTASTTTASTTTGSTTTSGCLPNKCFWTWYDGVWYLSTNECVAPCAACVTAPGFSGSSNGETATTNCEISI